MMPFEFQLIGTQCPICFTAAHDQEVYPANFSATDITPEVFSARREPDRKHYRMVICGQCRLMRANPILPQAQLAKLYEASFFTYAAESVDAAGTYAEYFYKKLEGVSKSAHILEIGCGNGSFLARLADDGFLHLFGVEPSREACAQAPGQVKGNIYNGILTKGIYPPNHFDVICVFQVFDHLADPVQFLNDCQHYLKPGGQLLMVMHDNDAWTFKLLGRKSPIVDIEHPFLYNRQSLSKLIAANGFNQISTFTVANRYPLRYWVKLMPLLTGVKAKVLAFLNKNSIGNWPLRLILGNMGIVAHRKA